VIAECHLIRRHLRGEIATAGRATRFPDLEDVGVVGAEAPGQLRRHVLNAVVGHHDALIQRAAPEKLPDRNVERRKGEVSPGRRHQSRVGQRDIHDLAERPDRGVEVQQAMLLKFEREVGEKAGAGVKHPFFAEAAGTNLTGLVEHGKGLSVFQHQRPATSRQRRRDEVGLGHGRRVRSITCS